MNLIQAMIFEYVMKRINIWSNTCFNYMVINRYWNIYDFKK